MWILYCSKYISICCVNACIRTCASRRVVRNETKSTVFSFRSFSSSSVISSWIHFSFEEFLCISRIFTSCLYINEEVIFTIFSHRFPYIFWRTGVWICLTCCQHTSDLILWIDLMSDSCCFCRRYQFMMCCKIFRLCLIFSFFKDKSRPHKWKCRIMLISLNVSQYFTSPLYLVKSTVTSFL